MDGKSRPQNQAMVDQLQAQEKSCLTVVEQRYQSRSVALRFFRFSFLAIEQQVRHILHLQHRYFKVPEIA